MRDLPQQGVSTDGYYSCPAGPPEGTLGPQPTDNTSRARKDSLLCAGTSTTINNIIRRMLGLYMGLGSFGMGLFLKCRHIVHT